VEINPKPAQACTPLLSCPPPRLASEDAGAGESKKGAAVYYLKGEHNRAYEDAFRTQEAI